MDINNQRHWLHVFEDLRTEQDLNLGVAPHQPLMLLTVMDLIEEGYYQNGWVSYDNELKNRFREYWPIVFDRRGNLPDIRMPFHALGATPQVWKRFKSDKEPSASRNDTRLCKLDPELLELMLDPGFRRKSREILIDRYFTPIEQIELLEMLDVSKPESEEISFLKNETEKYEIITRRAREIRFRFKVTAGYRFTCLLTGRTLLTEKGSMVEAAHIHAHAEDGPDDPSNGLSLSPDAHWMFDNGLWTLFPKGDNDFQIFFNLKAFRESSLTFMPYGDLHKTLVKFPTHSTLKPDPGHLAWHWDYFNFSI